MNTEIAANTHWQEWIGEMDFKSTATRRQHVLTWLHNARVPYFLQQYSSGVNVYVKLGEGPQYFAVSCHLDRVQGAGGANDNGAAIATCLELIAQYQHWHFQQSILILFFDEEETGLKGSRAYVQEFGFDHIHTLVNLELVGFGDCGILWPVTSNPNPNPITRQLISSTAENDTNRPLFAEPIVAMPEFPLYYSDADAFTEVGFKNAITFTRITSNDYERLNEYNRLKDEGADEDELLSLISKADVMKYYHNHLDNARIVKNNAIDNNVRFLKGLIEQ